MIRDRDSSCFSTRWPFLRRVRPRRLRHSLLARGDGAEALPVVFWRHRELLQECAAQGLFVAKACHSCDTFQRDFASFQMLPSCFYAQGLDPASWSRAKVLLKLASERARRHRDLFG